MRKLLLFVLSGCINLEGISSSPCPVDDFLEGLDKKYSYIHECVVDPVIKEHTIICNDYKTNVIYLTTEYVNETIKITYQGENIINISGSVKSPFTCVKDLYKQSVPSSNYIGHCSYSYKTYCSE